MELIKDYKFRSLLAEYIHWIFTTGIDRVWAHEAVCTYLIDNWDLYAEIRDIPEERKSQECNLHLLMAALITNDVFTNLKYPVDENGRAIHKKSNTKMLVDNFCNKLEEIKPILKKDLYFWLDKEGGERCRKV